MINFRSNFVTIKSGDIVTFNHTKGKNEVEEVGTVSLEIATPSKFSGTSALHKNLDFCYI